MAPALLHHRTRGDWWDILASTGSTLLVTREYEHLFLALGGARGNPEVSYLGLPHPSGLALDPEAGIVYLAATRNPNQVLAFRPVERWLPRSDRRRHGTDQAKGTLLPFRSTFYPGSLYLHDLSLIGGQLFGSACGHNAVVALHPDGTFQYRWWPRSIDGTGKPRFDCNYLQCNSIAAGPALEDSFFSASAERPGRRRPGHSDFPVDRRGVLFSGRTREPMAHGLTRPHSARIYRGKVWADNSGYGEVGFAEGGRFQAMARLPGWTRGLCFHGTIAFVGVSRVLPRFRQYAPGLDPERSQCGIFALDTRDGRVLGSISWPEGNQIFSVERAPGEMGLRLPFLKGKKENPAKTENLCYRYDPAVPPVPEAKPGPAARRGADPIPSNS